MTTTMHPTPVDARTRRDVAKERLIAALDATRSDERGQTTAEYALVLLSSSRSSSSCCSPWHKSASSSEHRSW